VETRQTLVEFAPPSFDRLIKPRWSLWRIYLPVDSLAQSEYRAKLSCGFLKNRRGKTACRFLSPVEENRNMKFRILMAVVLLSCLSNAFAAAKALTPVLAGDIGSSPSNNAVCTGAGGTCTNADFVNTNIPDATLYVAGSMNLGRNLLPNALTAYIFDASQPVISIADTSNDSLNWTPSPVANSLAAHGFIYAWVGTGQSALPAPYAGKLIYVVLNMWNSSGAALSQILYASTPKSFIREADVVLPGPWNTAKNVPYSTYTGAVANTCTDDTTTIPIISGTPVVDCATHGILQADVALSDVNLTEIAALEEPVGAGGAASTKPIDNAITELPAGMHTVPLGVQGFGVAVNPNLYADLQHQNVLDGLLDPSCDPAASQTITFPTASSVTFTTLGSGSNTDASTPGPQTSDQFYCMPILARGNYTMLTTAGLGKGRNAADILMGPNSSGNTTPVSVDGRLDYSGVQSASNMFFADNPCGATSVGSKTFVGALGGEQQAVELTTPAASLANNLTVASVMDFPGTRLVASPSNYAIGVLSLAEVPDANAAWKFVRLDSASPVHDLLGNADPTQSIALSNGTYPFVMTAFAVFPSKPLAKRNIYGTATGIDGVASDSHYNAANSLLPTLIAGLKDSTQATQMPGFGYIDHVAGGNQQAHCHHAGDNNCAPLVLY
jgi:hypothetical protein